jgi:hypothetical protein
MLGLAGISDKKTSILGANRLFLLGKAKNCTLVETTADVLDECIGDLSEPIF